MEIASGPFVPWEAQGPLVFVKCLHLLSRLFQAGTCHPTHIPQCERTWVLRPL